MIEFGKTAEVTFRGSDGKTFSTEAKVDTGAERTTVDINIAATIKAGPVVKTVKVTQASGTDRRPAAMVTVEYEDLNEEVAVGLADRKTRGLDHRAIIGCDILELDDVVIDL